jgi:DNA-binding PadR family transcriptional regulator
MNSDGGQPQNAGAAARGGHKNAAPAQFTVGAVNFDWPWGNDDDGFVQLTEKGRQAVADNMAASIIRLECEADELRAEVALLREQAKLLAAERDTASADAKVYAERLTKAELTGIHEMARLERERDEARIQYRSTHTLAEVMVKSRNEFLEALRDIAKMDTSQGATGNQCAAVWRAMEALK